MANNNDKAEGGRAVTAARSKLRGSDRPFDTWLHKQLHAMYDDIASEPLPDDLLNLIEKDAAEQKNGSSDEPPKE